MKNEDTCPCKSGKTFGECCGPIISGEKKAETPEALMRARYSSYVTGDVLFLKRGVNVLNRPMLTRVTADNRHPADGT